MAGSELLAPTQEENERLARAFERSNVEGFVEAAEGERLLRRTGLQEGRGLELRMVLGCFGPKFQPLWMTLKSF